MFQLVALDHPVLLGKAEPVEFPAPLAQTYAGMLATMLNHQGIGLAAPQVGISLRMFVYRVNRAMGLIVNPEITGRSREFVETKEGCLSLPGKAFMVKRSKWIDFSYQDMDGKKITKRVSDLLAIVVQHETDHLDGILISQIGHMVE